MSKVVLKTAVVKTASMPVWIDDKNNQNEWNGRFVEILSRDYKNLDSTIATILKDGKLAQICAVKIRSYVDKRVTTCFYERRKVRGAKHRKRLEIAISGMNAAVDISKDRGNHAAALHFAAIALEYSAELGRCKDAYATKRHGRDRAHSTLSECRSFLESKLGQPLSCATLANMVNAGHEADGNLPKEPITEEHIRKNLAHFKYNNPSWQNEIDPRLRPCLVNPATK
jgi:hypothetical protein